MSEGPSRRAFLEAAGAALALAACGRRAAHGATAMQGGGGLDAGGAEIPMRMLGSTGVFVSCMGLGGYHLGVPSEDEAIRIVHQAIDHGLTFLDNSWDYNGGDSLKRMGKALAQGGYRDRAFLMSKVDGRTAASAAAQIDQSLQMLQTDHLDLLQLHEVIRDGDPAAFFAPGGAVEAFVRAREQGKARFLGFTGHKSPRIHLAMLEAAAKHGFRFDTVQMPLNVMDAGMGDESFEKRVLPVLQQRGIAALGMKPMGDQIILGSHLVTAVECLRYAMSLPVATTITGVDSLGILGQDLHVALGFEPMSDADRSALLARVADAARTGQYEKYKTTTQFDSTAQHPQWLDTGNL